MNLRSFLQYHNILLKNRKEGAIIVILVIYFKSPSIYIYEGLKTVSVSCLKENIRENTKKQGRRIVRELQKTCIIIFTLGESRGSQFNHMV